MPYFGEGLSGAGGGAAIGSLFGPVGTAIGAGAGFIAGLFGGESPEEQHRKRVNQALARLETLKRNAVLEGGTRISKQTASTIARGRQSAASRAVAQGRAGDAESFIAPVESEVAGQGADALSRYVEDTNRSYDQAKVAAELSQLDVPFEPGAGDYIATIGRGALAYKLDKDYLDKFDTSTSPEMQARQAGLFDNEYGTGVESPSDADFENSPVDQFRLRNKPSGYSVLTG